MKLFSCPSWMAAFKAWRRRAHHHAADAGDMGTAFGLDSITIVDFEPSEAPATKAPSWQRRLDRRSRL
jgi:hypothetical protein